MKQIGTVVEIADNMARVECDRQSACDMCENAEHCVEKCKKVYATALNTVGAKTGDTVEIESDTKNVLLNAFVVFVIPIVLAVLSYFGADFFFGEGISVAVTMAVLVLSLFVSSLLMNKRAKKQAVSRIVRIL